MADLSEYEEAKRAIPLAPRGDREIKALYRALHLADQVITEARAQALREAADAWQHGQWADAPRRASRVEERIANGQYVGDWLRARAGATDA